MFSSFCRAEEVLYRNLPLSFLRHKYNLFQTTFFHLLQIHPCLNKKIVRNAILTITFLVLYVSLIIRKKGTRTCENHQKRAIFYWSGPWWYNTYIALKLFSLLFFPCQEDLENLKKKNRINLQRCYEQTSL